MTRPLRIEYPGAFYHVLNRGNRRENIFLSDEDFDLFLEVVRETHEKFAIRVLSYCLMHNHYHLLIHTPRPNLQKAMAHLGSIYTRRFNRLHKTDGHLFRGRYKAILVQEEDYLRNLIRYIHSNPLKAGIALNLSGWPYSSHRFYLNLERNPAPSFLDLKGALKLFSDSIETYLEFMGSGVDPQTERFYSTKKLKPVFGSENFKKRVLKRLVPLSKEIECREELEGAPDPNAVLEAVCQAFVNTPSEVRSIKKGERNDAASLAMALLSRKGLSHKEIVKFLGMSSDKAVSVSIHRFNERLKLNPDLAELYGALKCNM